MLELKVLTETMPNTNPKPAPNSEVFTEDPGQDAEA